MLDFELPTTGRERSPAFLAANECREWLDKIPLTNASLAQPLVLSQLELLHRYELPAVERLGILEALRGTLSKLQDAAANTFAARPLPFSPAEQKAFDATLEVWELLALGYLRCFAATTDAQGPDVPALRARLAQRALSTFADWQVDLCRGEQLPDSGYWHRLHQLMGACENAGIATLRVSDPVRHGLNGTTALAAYAECNLLGSASLYELPLRQLRWVARWARRWGGKLAKLEQPPEDIRARAVPLWVDLDSDQPPSYQPRPGGRGRWLETTELRRSLATRIERLERGESPAALQLGDDVTQPGAAQLLRRMLQRWCQGGTPRIETRRPASGACGVVVGFEPAHRELSGGMRFVASSDLAMLRRDREEFEVFGDRRHRLAASSRRDACAETWQLVDEWQLLNRSAGGLRIRRELGAGARVGAGQLVAIRPGDDMRFGLAAVRWALRDGTDALTAGIQVFPGEPVAAAVRILDGAGDASPWRPAFALPVMPELDVPASLVLGSGSFRLERRVELRIGEEIRILILCGMLDHGSDFERCLVRTP